ncbi:hypothetical protein AKO1_009521 [Acrasis kona]|uniref:MJ1316 RNA cyclic group end recognition domain-containing protein n=1 Tax=Acrasis kona TaxID=1008807 RepID=A0AAW2ZM58_9EUKA
MNTEVQTPQKKRRNSKRKDNAEDEVKKEKLTTSDAIINRLRWDPSLPANDFVIGYLDRFLGIVESTLETHEWDEIPLHRIYYFKYKKLKVWDRNTRMDRISSGKIYRIMKEYDPDKVPSYAPEKIDPEAASDEVNDGQESSESESEYDAFREIIFSDRNKGADQYKLDKLELWLLTNHTNIPKQCKEYPTHISQKGGHYHLPTELVPKFVKKWADCINKEKNFYLDEIPTPLFRLFVDIDVKSTELDDIYDIVQTEWLNVISRYTENYFSKLKDQKSQVDASVVVTECHSNIEDSSTPTARHKSGYRLHFRSIFVDAQVHKKYITSLGLYLESQFHEYENQPKGWTFLDVINVKMCEHTKVRLFGSTKYRRGKDLDRKYTFLGVFGNNAVYDQHESDRLKNDLESLLFHTIVRYDYIEQEGKVQVMKFTQ